MGVNKVYEREVISIPASVTIGIIEKYSIHVHPNKVNGYSYKSVMYYCFREEYGWTRKLYILKNTISLDPKDMVF